MELKVNEKLEKDVLKIDLEGRLDTTTYPMLEEVIAKHIDNVNRIDIDMKNLVYVSSAGLRVILSVHKKLDGKDGLHLYNTTEEVKEIFDITGFINILNLD